MFALFVLSFEYELCQMNVEWWRGEEVVNLGGGGGGVVRGKGVVDEREERMRWLSSIEARLKPLLYGCAGRRRAVVIPAVLWRVHQFSQIRLAKSLFGAANTPSVRPVSLVMDSTHEHKQ